MMSEETLQSLGWRPFFSSQLAIEDDPDLRPARVLAVHRGRIDVAIDDSQASIELSGSADGQDLTVGDWVLLDKGAGKVVKILDRSGVFKRRAAGSSGETQLIAANVDTLFIVTSANRDFNVARLERYLAIAHDAGAYPVVVISKADTCDSVMDFVNAAARLSPGLLVEALDSRDAGAVEVLRPWCVAGQTVALLGSSGVGKSTLVNTLAGTAQETQSVRDDDLRGRHTTTGRTMHALPAGGWLIDTPGMRELQLVDVGNALDDVFSDVAALAETCRFGDCSHENEPGCAVLEAITVDGLDPDRLRRYRKLLAEDRRNSESEADRRSRDKNLGKMHKTIQEDRRQRKGSKN